jgi:pimeloyl-ACP methyl ester carboxylesterase
LRRIGLCQLVRVLLVLVLLVLAAAPPAMAAPRWQSLPPTPSLPVPDHAGMAEVNGIRLFYAVYGQGPPVMLLHGGLASANWWGLQIPALAAHRQVIVPDSRGHGRSTRGESRLGYGLMASDMLGLMDRLHIARAALVGWSDGAIIGLDLALHHPGRVSRLFAFGANADPSGLRPVAGNPVFAAYLARARGEFRTLSPTPGDFDALLADLSAMWRSEPRFRAADLQRITVPTWIVAGDHDEAIRRDHTDRMAALIPGARAVILPEVSHFAQVQDPDGFNRAVLRFLAEP